MSFYGIREKVTTVRCYRSRVGKTLFSLLLLIASFGTVSANTCPSDYSAASANGFYNGANHPNSFGFAALDDVGRISTWGATWGGEGGSVVPSDSGYVSIMSNAGAFAALDSSGGISTWGAEHYGGSGAPYGTGYVSVASNYLNFAALHSSGFIRAWPSTYGAPSGNNYVSITSNQGAFAALDDAGRISAWGDGNNGGSGAPINQGYISVASSYGAFAALHSNGNIDVWGNANSGGSGAPSGAGFVSIASNVSAFAALDDIGRISVWGAAASGGAAWGGLASGGDVAPSGAGYVSIASTRGAFAALHDTGHIKVWGYGGTGGTGAPSGASYISIVSNDSAFAALHATGRISVWGDGGSGGSGAPSDSGYVSIVSNGDSFAALDDTGHISAWGNATKGGSGAPTGAGYVSIASNGSAFAALNDTGHITAWGDASYGGSGAPTGAGYVSILNRGATTNPRLNLPPTISGLPGTTVDVGNVYSFVPEATGPEAPDALSFSIVNKPTWASFDTSTGVLTGKPVVADTGTTSNVTVSVSDGNNTVELDPFDLTVEFDNNAPIVANAVANQNATEDSTYSFAVPVNTINDVDAVAGDSLTWSAIGLPSWLSFDSTTRVLSGIPLQAHVGDSVVSVRGTDLMGAYADSSFTLSVADVNDNTPVILSSQSTAVPENSIDTFYRLLAMDVDTDDTLQFSLSGIDVEFFNIDSASGELRLAEPGDYENPRDDGADRTYSLILQVSDSVGNITTKPLSVTLTDVNEAPSALDQNFLVGEFSTTGSTVGNLEGLDPERQELHWTLQPGSAPFLVSDTGRISVNGVLDFESNSRYQLVVNLDDGVLSEPVSVTIAIGDGDEFAQLTNSGDQREELLQELGVTGVLDERGTYYEHALQALGEGQGSTVEQLQVAIDAANAVAIVVERASLGNDTTIIEQLIAAGVSAVNSANSAAYGYAIKSAESMLLDRADLQAVVNQVNINEQNSGVGQSLSYPVIWLQVEQGGTQVDRIRLDGGSVVVQAKVRGTQQDLSLSYDWSQSSGRLLTLVNSPNPVTDTLIFDPLSLLAGEKLPIRVAVIRDGLSAETELVVLLAGRGVSADQVRDSDGDGIQDAFDGELDGSTHNEVDNYLQALKGEDLRYVIESDLGTTLRLGNVARQSMNNQATVSQQSMITHAPDSTVATVTGALPENVSRTMSELFDVQVTELPSAGASVTVVLPLIKALGANPGYLVFDPASGWVPFREDEFNRLRSAPALGGVPGQCLEPGGNGWSDGLTQGHSCIEVLLEDGGRNDADSYNRDDKGMNGSISGPWAIFSDDEVPLAATGGESSGSAGGESSGGAGGELSGSAGGESSGGGGSVSLWWIGAIVMLLMGQIGARAKVRTISTSPQYESGPSVYPR